MQTIAALSKVLLSVAVMAICAQADAAEPEPEPAPQAAAPSAPPKGLECHDAALTGSGPGFKSSQDESEAAAIADWLEKAKAIYPDATWEGAKDPFMQCVKQGLYSKCFATGFPCRPKPE
jgi:hypothetical protein